MYLKIYRSLITLFFFGCFSNISLAQITGGIHFGVTDNYLANASLSPFNEMLAKIGFNGNVSVNYQLKKWFSAESGIGFIQKNYEVERTDFFEGSFTNTINNYLQVPLKAKFWIHNGKTSYFAHLGIYAAYWTASSQNGTLANILNTSDTSNGNPSTIFSLNDKYIFNQKHNFTNQDNRFQFGWTSGIGMNYQLSNKNWLQLDISCEFSLSDQQKKYQLQQVSMYNNTLIFEIGYVMKLAGKKNSIE